MAEKYVEKLVCEKNITIDLYGKVGKAINNI